MKIDLQQNQTNFTVAFDYPNLVVGTYIPFIWDLNTNLFNTEGRLWNYSSLGNFYVKFISQYTHKEYRFYGSVDFTNNRYTQATFYSFDEIENIFWQLSNDFWNENEFNWEYEVNLNTFINEADSGFYYTYFVVENDLGEGVVIYETLTNIQIEGKEPTFISNITDNETRQIIYAN